MIGSPGHHPAAITVYDPWTGFLLTGDTVLPGRLYARDFAAFTAALDTLVAFAQSRPVAHVLGCHIEMTRRPGRDFPLGAFNDFIIFNGHCTSALPKMFARALASRLRLSLTVPNWQRDSGRRGAAGDGGIPGPGR